MVINAHLNNAGEYIVRIKHWRRITVGVLSLGGVLVIALAVTIWWVLRQSLPPIEGELRVPGLHTAVTIDRDDAGVPVIRLVIVSLPPLRWGLSMRKTASSRWTC